MTHSPNAPRPADPLVRQAADMIAAIERNYDREGSGPGSRFEGRRLEDVQAEAVTRLVRAAVRQATAAVLTREEVTAVATHLHDESGCGCDPRYLKSCVNMASAVLQAGQAIRARAEPPGPAEVAYLYRRRFARGEEFGLYRHAADAEARAAEHAGDGLCEVLSMAILGDRPGVQKPEVSRDAQEALGPVFADPYMTALQAIGLFLEYRDQHGHDEPSARVAAALEVAEGAAVTDDEIAVQSAPEIRIADCSVHDGAQHVQVSTGPNWLCGVSLAVIFAEYEAQRGDGTARGGQL